MEIIWTAAETCQEDQPNAIDITSSETYVYLRRNIVQETRTDEMSGDEIDYWSYDEAKLTKEEYEQYSESLIYQALAEQTAAIDDANAMVMLSQANIEATQADQDETLALILENTTTT